MFTLSLPVAGMGRINENDPIPPLAQKAVEDIWFAIGAEVTPVLPVRVKAPSDPNDGFFSERWKFRDNLFYEPIFSSESEDPQMKLANFYFSHLKLIHSLSTSNREERCELIEKCEHTENHSLQGCIRAFFQGLDFQQKQKQVAHVPLPSAAPFPNTYEAIWSQEQGNDFEKAKALLRDYESKGKGLNALLFCHCNRHHAATVASILDDREISTLDALLQKMQEKTNHRNMLGSLARRMQFIEEKTDKVTWVPCKEHNGPSAIGTPGTV